MIILEGIKRVVFCMWDKVQSTVAEIDYTYRDTSVRYEKVIGGQKCNISVYFEYDLYKDNLFVKKYI